MDHVEVWQRDSKAPLVAKQRFAISNSPGSDKEAFINEMVKSYTDGITDAGNPHGTLFGTARLDHALENCLLQASALLDAVLRSVEVFTDGHPANDDRTLIVARVS